MEATDRLGGQLLLACKGRVRRQVRGVADWLIAEVDRLGVDIRLNCLAEAADVLAEAPDAVIVATGGWPDPPAIPGGALALSSWDVLAGRARPAGAVLLFDEAGDQAGAVTADVLAEMGCTVDLVTPDRSVLHELGPTTSAVALRQLARDGVRMTCLHELLRVDPIGAKRRVTLRHVLTGQSVQREVDHVVVEHGLTPSDALYHELKSGSLNHGQLDHGAMIAGTDPFRVRNPDGHYRLARIGDAVAGRNIHAAIFDALRVCRNL